MIKLQENFLDERRVLSKLVQGVLKDIADEERVHTGEFLKLLYHLAPDEEEFYKEGSKKSKGIGQALLYLHYGINEVFLIIAYHSDEHIPKEAKDKIGNKILDVLDSIKLLSIDKFLGLDVILIFPTHLLHQNLLKTNKGISKSSDFDRTARNFDLGRRLIIKPDDYDHRKQCLLNEEFSWDKKLYNKIHSK